LALEHGLGASEWATQEFGGVELGDTRLRDRLMKIAEDRWKRPDASYLEAAGGDRGATKGYYSFIRQSLGTLFIRRRCWRPTGRRTIERIMAHDTVLVVQDTTDLNFSTRPHTEGLGPIGTNQTGAESLGLKLHSCLALTTEGVPLGVLRSVCYAPERKGKAGQQSIGRSIEQKKSFRWLEGYRDCVQVAKKTPETRLLAVMDREADIFELFLDAEPTRKRVGLLVRAKHDRNLADSQRKLFEELKASRHMAYIEAVIPRQRWKKAKRGNPSNRPSRRGRPS